MSTNPYITFYGGGGGSSYFLPPRPVQNRRRPIWWLLLNKLMYRLPNGEWEYLPGHDSGWHSAEGPYRFSIVASYPEESPITYLD